MCRFLLRRKPESRETLWPRGSLAIIHLLSSLPGEITVKYVPLDQKTPTCKLTKILKFNHIFPKSNFSSSSIKTQSGIELPQCYLPQALLFIIWKDALVHCPENFITKHLQLLHKTLHALPSRKRSMNSLMEQINKLNYYYAFPSC